MSPDKVRDYRNWYDLNAEPLQKRVIELHSHLEMLGASEVFGSEYAFRRNYVKTGQSSFYQRAMACSLPLPCAGHQSVSQTCCSSFAQVSFSLPGWIEFQRS